MGRFVYNYAVTFMGRYNVMGRCAASLNKEVYFFVEQAGRVDIFILPERNSVSN
jgi:enoyl-[acyl-carrier-protein] reductase (NADH)